MMAEDTIHIIKPTPAKFEVSEELKPYIERSQAWLNEQDPLSQFTIRKLVDAYETFLLKGE
jgi:hypothetical protein